MSKSIFLLIGTYEELLLCYRYDYSNSSSNNDTVEFEQIFTDHSHSKSVRSVAISTTGRYFASGGSDESLEIFSHLFSRPRQIGTVLTHASTVQLLRFVGDDRLISVDDGGTMCIWKSTDFETPVHVFPKTHKRCAPTDVAVHPSGRLALTVAGKDRTLRTWDLINLRQAACTNLGGKDDDEGDGDDRGKVKEPISVFWSKSGSSYGVLFAESLDVFSTADCQRTTEVQFESSSPTATSACFVADNKYAVVGFQNGRVTLFKTGGGIGGGDQQHHTKSLNPSTSEQGRIKSLVAIDDIEIDDEGEGSMTPSGLIAAATSSGWIRIFRYSRSEFEQVASINVGARITCMAAAIRPGDEDVGGGETSGQKETKKKRKASAMNGNSEKKKGKKKRKI